MTDIVGDDKDLRQIVQICRRAQDGVLGDAGFVEARVLNIAEDEILGVDCGAGGDDLIIVAQDGLRRQIVHAQTAGVAGGVSALHHAGVTGGGNAGADLQRGVQNRRDLRPVPSDLRDQPDDLTVFRDDDHAGVKAGVRALANGKGALPVGGVPGNHIGGAELVVLVFLAQTQQLAQAFVFAL